MIPNSVIDLKAYTDKTGKALFAKWLAHLDRAAASRVAIVLGRLEEGNTSQIKSLGEGVYELRIAFGPGYRIYLGREGERVVILLWGGTKHRQSDDIARAKQLWKAYQAERE